MQSDADDELNEPQTRKRVAPPSDSSASRPVKRKRSGFASAVASIFDVEVDATAAPDVAETEAAAPTDRSLLAAAAAPMLARPDAAALAAEVRGRSKLHKRETHEATQKKELREKIRRTRERRERNHIVPDAGLNATRERHLRKLATKGVVSLFNQVEKHQRRREDDISRAGPNIKRKVEAEKQVLADFAASLGAAPADDEASD